jgi:hypothetical protein
MAATELLAIGNTAATTDPLDIEAGDVVAVCLKAEGGDIPAGASILIKLVDDDSNEYKVGRLTPSDPSLVLSVPGSYVFERLAGSKNVGVFRAG